LRQGLLLQLKFLNTPSVNIIQLIGQRLLNGIALFDTLNLLRLLIPHIQISQNEELNPPDLEYLVGSILNITTFSNNSSNSIWKWINNQDSYLMEAYEVVSDLHIRIKENKDFIIKTSMTDWKLLMNGLNASTRHIFEGSFAEELFITEIYRTCIALRYPEWQSIIDILKAVEFNVFLFFFFFFLFFLVGF